MSEARSGSRSRNDRCPAYRLRSRGYFFEQFAPEGVSGHAQNGTLICRADANATADAGFDPANPAFYAVGGQGNDVAAPSVANKPVESGTS
jgi:hypothetical protein